MYEFLGGGVCTMIGFGKEIFLEGEPKLTIEMISFPDTLYNVPDTAPGFAVSPRKSIKHTLTYVCGRLLTAL